MSSVFASFSHNFFNKSSTSRHIISWKIFQKVPESILGLNIIVFSTVCSFYYFIKLNHKGLRMWKCLFQLGISWTLSAPNHDVTILTILPIMMVTILPLTDIGWTGRSAHTLDDPMAAYHITKTPGAVPVSGQFSTPIVLAVDRCPIEHLSSRLIGARCQMGCCCCCCSADLDCAAATWCWSWSW